MRALAELLAGLVRLWLSVLGYAFGLGLVLLAAAFGALAGNGLVTLLGGGR